MANRGHDDRQHLAALLITPFFAAFLFGNLHLVEPFKISSENQTNIFSPPVPVAVRLFQRRIFAAGLQKREQLSGIHHHSKPSELGFPPPTPPGQQQIQNLILALRKSGLFGAVAGAIGGLNLVMLPQQTTIFVPTDSAFQSVKDAEKMELFQYHVAVQRFAFAQLFNLNQGDTLPTLLAGNSIVVTSNQIINFTLDDVRLISPDLYFDNTIVVHGIGGILNYTVYGNGKQNPTALSPPPQTSHTPTSRSPDSILSPLIAPPLPGLTASPPSVDDSGTDNNAAKDHSPLPLPSGSEIVAVFRVLCLFGVAFSVFWLP